MENKKTKNNDNTHGKYNKYKRKTFYFILLFKKRNYISQAKQNKKKWSFYCKEINTKFWLLSPKFKGKVCEDEQSTSSKPPCDQK